MSQAFALLLPLQNRPFSPETVVLLVENHFQRRSCPCWEGSVSRPLPWRELGNGLNTLNYLHFHP